MFLRIEYKGFVGTERQLANFQPTADLWEEKYRDHKILPLKRDFAVRLKE